MPDRTHEYPDSAAADTATSTRGRPTLASTGGRHRRRRKRGILPATYALAFGLALLALLAGIHFGGADGPPAASTPTSGAYFGSWVAPRAGESRADAIERVEAQIGRRFAIDHQYYRWDSNFPGAHEAWTVSRGGSRS